MRRFSLPIIAALALAGCGPSESQSGLTAEEERQLDNAAAMLDDNMVDVSPDSLVADEADLEAMETPPGSGAGQAVENAQ